MMAGMTDGGDLGRGVPPGAAIRLASHAPMTGPMAPLR
jgi:hypothetical protein